MSREAMKLALEALEIEDMACRYEKEPTPEHIAKAITALREELAEQPAQQEPFTHYRHYDNGLQDWADEKTIPLYTSPPAQRTWVGLTDEEIKQAMDYWSSDEHSAYGGAASAAGEYFDVETSWRYIEAKLKEKNT